MDVIGQLEKLHISMGGIPMGGISSSNFSAVGIPLWKTAPASRTTKNGWPLPLGCAAGSSWHILAWLFKGACWIVHVVPLHNFGALRVLQSTDRYLAEALCLNSVQKSASFAGYGGTCTWLSILYV